MRLSLERKADELPLLLVTSAVLIRSLTFLFAPAGSTLVTRSIPNGRALKDWPDEWHSGAMSRFTGSKYNQRKDIAEEYTRYAYLVSSVPTRPF